MSGTTIRETDLSEFDAVGSAELIRLGEVASDELVEAAIARIERCNARLNAVILPLFERAREAVRAGLPTGPFRGVPFLLKDLLDGFEGDPYHAGMSVLKAEGYTSSATSVLAARYRAAGFVLLGKTNTPELGLHVTTEPRAYGPSRNPWNPEHSTGGSSGGSGAAVAAGLVAVAHANDGGGSIRIPASECGLVGLKPTRGRISLGPERGEAWSGFINSHVVTRSVRDSAAILDATAGPSPGDPYTAPPPRRPYAAELGTPPGVLRIGVMSQSPKGAAQTHMACCAAAEEAGRLLEALGHHVEADHPRALDEHEAFVEGFSAMVAADTARSLAQWGERLGRTLSAEDVEPGTWFFAELGRALSAVDFLEAQERLQLWSRRIASWWSEQRFDLLVTPTLGAPPPRLGELLIDPSDLEASLERVFAMIPYTAQWNATGQPAVSLPLAWTAEGLPVGVQLVAAMGREDLLFRVASELERARPWSNRRPVIWAGGR